MNDPWRAPGAPKPGRTQREAAAEADARRPGRKVFVGLQQLQAKGTPRRLAGRPAAGNPAGSCPR
eukprot:11291647-Alexandrium_andersonii.AAC.1